MFNPKVTDSVNGPRFSSAEWQKVLYALVLELLIVIKAPHRDAIAALRKLADDTERILAEHPEHERKANDESTFMAPEPKLAA